MFTPLPNHTNKITSELILLDIIFLTIVGTAGEGKGNRAENN